MGLHVYEGVGEPRKPKKGPEANHESGSDQNVSERKKVDLKLTKTRMTVALAAFAVLVFAGVVNKTEIADLSTDNDYLTSLDPKDPKWDEDEEDARVVFAETAKAMGIETEILEEDGAVQKSEDVSNNPDLATFIVNSV